MLADRRAAPQFQGLAHTETNNRARGYIMPETMTITTDTATICVFDPERVQHRLNDRPDWWSARSEELQETNNGNIMIVNVFADGCYKLYTHDGPVTSTGRAVRAKIACSSGVLFIGPGEEITGGQSQPQRGLFIPLVPGTYRVTVAERVPVDGEDDDHVEIGIEPIDETPANRFTDSLQLYGGVR
jgi:hypothetical protein